MDTKPKIKRETGKDEIGLGYIDFFCETSKDYAFRESLRPVGKQTLQFVEIDDRRFRLALVTGGEDAGDEPLQHPRGKLLTMSREDLLDYAAQQGVEVEGNPRKADIIGLIQEKLNGASRPK